MIFDKLLKYFKVTTNRVFNQIAFSKLLIILGLFSTLVTYNIINKFIQWAVKQILLGNVIGGFIDQFTMGSKMKDKVTRTTKEYNYEDFKRSCK